VPRTVRDGRMTVWGALAKFGTLAGLAVTPLGAVIAVALTQNLPWPRAVLAGFGFAAAVLLPLVGTAVVREYRLDRKTPGPGHRAGVLSRSAAVTVTVPGRLGPLTAALRDSIAEYAGVEPGAVRHAGHSLSVRLSPGGDTPWLRLRATLEREAEDRTAVTVRCGPDWRLTLTDHGHCPRVVRDVADRARALASG
jgi:hypothetical protein